MPFHYTVLSNIKRHNELPKFVHLNRPPYYRSQTTVAVLKGYRQDTRPRCETLVAFSLPHSPSEAGHPPNCTLLLADLRKCASLLQPPSLLLLQPSEHQSLPGENSAVNAGQKEVLETSNAPPRFKHCKPLSPKQPLEASLTHLLLSRNVPKQQAKE